MKKILALLAASALSACGDDAPPPKPQAPAPQASAPAPITPAPAPEAAKPPEEPKPDPNKELAQRVKQALEKDGKVQVAAIDVTVKEGRVSLWGTAATAGERSRAAQIASKVEGVASVDNQIKVVKGS
jgi:hyperosmotically inducible periplasmic protein